MELEYGSTNDSRILCHLFKGLVSSLFFLSTAVSDVSLTLTLTPGVLLDDDEDNDDEPGTLFFLLVPRAMMSMTNQGMNK